MNAFFNQSERLRAENYQLKKKIEQLQAEGYIGKLLFQHTEEMAKKDRKINRLQLENEKLNQRRSEDLARIRSLEYNLSISQLELSELNVQVQQNQISTKAKLEERDGVIQKLTAQINRDYTNSSIPSSMCIGHGVIHNGRVKSGRKPGGQPGHTGHSRKKHIPNNQIKINAPCSCASCSAKKLMTTGRTKTKQLIDLKIEVSATDFISDEYYCPDCGERFYANFPSELVNEVNYGSDIKTLSTFLNNYCNVSLDKTAEVLYEISGGNIKISKGTLCNFSKELTRKTATYMNEIALDLREAPVIHTDATNARVNGKSAYIFVFANNNGKLYSAQPHKGIAALTGSPIDNYSGITVHDHESSFYRFGQEHQECNIHILRYLLDAAENEPHLTWHNRMRQLLLNMNQDRKVLLSAGESSFKESSLKSYYSQYQKILDDADKEYFEHPPTKYYPTGFNLAARLRKFKEHHLLFLNNFLVPFDNNLSERSLRIAKGKMKTAGTFRSLSNGLLRYCNFLSIVETSKCKGTPVYQTVKEIYSDECKLWNNP